MFTHAAALYACVSWHLVAGTVLMQERGDLHQDEDGQWLEGEAIDWTTLPVKVEGVIEKRIERLAGEPRTILTIASVEGETFTAEVVARVQQVDQRTVVQQLSRELDKRHRLVTAQAVERLDSGQQRLSLYRFRHNLFQHYLYQNLDEPERGYLHEAVGNAPEQLYAGRTEAVAGRLAHHFQIACLVSKAIDYLQQAGDASAAVYANVEAAAHYTRALELINPDEAASETGKGSTFSFTLPLEEEVSLKRIYDKLADETL